MKTDYHYAEMYNIITKSLCTEILIRLLVHGYDAITRTFIIVYNIWMGRAGGLGDGLPMVSRVSL